MHDIGHSLLPLNIFLESGCADPRFVILAAVHAPFAKVHVD